MLQYLLSHPAYSFSPKETADLCEAFDMALAALHDRESLGVNLTTTPARDALAEEIVAAWTRGERDPKRLAEQTVDKAETLFAQDEGGASPSDAGNPPGGD